MEIQEHMNKHQSSSTIIGHYYYYYQPRLIYSKVSYLDYGSFPSMTKHAGLFPY